VEPRPKTANVAASTQYGPFGLDAGPTFFETNVHTYMPKMMALMHAKQKAIVQYWPKTN
jgi:hypothetical protein